MTLKKAENLISEYREYDEESKYTVTLNVDELIVETEEYFVFACRIVENGAETQEICDFTVSKNDGYVLPVPV